MGNSLLEHHLGLQPSGSLQDHHIRFQAEGGGDTGKPGQLGLLIANIPATVPEFQRSVRHQLDDLRILSRIILLTANRKHYSFFHTSASIASASS